ncbi:MAG TPA: hypothetical protein VF623_09560 [Segetibacter sp.]|jgi:hypothetical protein
MFDELEKYKNKNHFFVNEGDDLEVVCNAPDKPGVFIVYALVAGRIELVYIGYSSSHYKEVEGKPITIEFDILKEEIVNGVIFNKKPNKTTLPAKIVKEKIDALDIYWYVTLDKKTRDFPEDVERAIMQAHIHIYERLPKWNKLHK